MAEPPPKKIKSRRSSQSFREAYTEEWPCIVKSRIDPHHAFCTVCVSDFSIAHSGRFDCRTHVNGAKHKEISNTVKQKTIMSMFKPLSESKEYAHSMKVIKAAASMAKFIAKNNLSMAVADELPTLMKKIAPDSTILKDVKCGRPNCQIATNF